MFAFTCQVCLASLMMTVMITLSNARPQQLQEAPHNLLDIETPNQFSYNSPLQQPDSLRSKPYFDFLSTLYAHDTDKTNLFRPYSGRPRREAVEPNHRQERKRRAIVFRPLFVYKQQEIRRQELKEDQANRRNGQAYALSNRRYRL